MKKDKVQLPFEIDRTSPFKLPAQVADGLRAAITSGFYKPGDKLPSSRDLHKMLDVSVRAPMEALRQLAEEGLVMLKPKTGAVVTAKNLPRRKGHVLLVRMNAAQWHDELQESSHIAEQLSAAGYLVTSVDVAPLGSGRLDLSALHLALRHKPDFVYSLRYREPVIRLIAEHGIPQATHRRPHDPVPRECVGTVTASWAAAHTAFAAHCAEAGVRRVIVVRKRATDPVPTEQLRAIGVKVDEWVISAPQVGRIAALERTTLRAFDRRFEKERRKWLPDVLFFNDYYTAYGAIVSLLSNGVRIPEDVAFVCLQNIGGGPVLRVPLTRYEVDTRHSDKVIGDALLEYLNKGVFPKDVMIGPIYRIGGTFPRKPISK